MSMRRMLRLFAVVCVCYGASVQVTSAGSHLWRINEIYSNYDGTIQFVELHECCGSSGEIGLNGKKLVSQATGHMFTISGNLTPPTTNKYLLFATAAFAALPGAPTPNYILPSGFFGINGDTIRWSPVDLYDTFTFSAGQLPVDGVNSIQVTDYGLDTFVTATNSPTNYTGPPGSVVAPPPTPAVSTWGMIVVVLLFASVGTVVSRRRGVRTNN